MIDIIQFVDIENQRTINGQWGRFLWSLIGIDYNDNQSIDY
jgi:hypothetical protein